MIQRRVYEPRPYAPLAMRHFREHPRCALFAKPGMGKTTMAMTFLDTAHRVWGEDAPTLVLGPKRVAQDVWSDEVQKWQHLRGLEVSTIVGTAAERVLALKRDVPVHTLNYENLMWLRDHLKATDRAWPYRRVIADESTRLKNFRLRQGGARAQALAGFAHKDVHYWINLTGTPSPNGLVDLWGQMWFLDEGARLGRTFSAFEGRYFAWKNKGDAFAKGKAGVKQVILPHSHELIHEKIADLCLTLDPKDWFDIKDPVVTIIDVDLPRSAMTKYREFERDLFTQIDGADIEAFAAAGKSLKCLQMANGFAYVDGVQWVPSHEAKLDALASIVEELGEPLLVAYHFKPDREMLLRRFPDALDLANDAHLKAAKRGEGRMWLAHPASLGHGVDGLQEHCAAACFYAHWWDLELHDQIIERIGPMRQLQAGKDRPVMLYYLAARGTIDRVVIERRSGKTTVQDALLNYMRGKR